MEDLLRHIRGMSGHLGAMRDVGAEVRAAAQHVPCVPHFLGANYYAVVPAFSRGNCCTMGVRMSRVATVAMPASGAAEARSGVVRSTT